MRKLDIAAEYVRRYSEHDSRAIARVIIANEPELFANLENARAAVRRVRGNYGDQRKHHAVPDLIRPNGVAGMIRTLPDPVIPVDRSDYVLEGSRSLIISDLHIPHHKPKEILTALDYGEANGLETIVLNGDTIDFHKISRFVHNPRNPSTAEELSRTKEFLLYLRERFPKTPIIYKEGNHCERLSLYILEKAPELFGEMPGHKQIDLRWALDLDDLGIIHIKDKRVIRQGHLNIIHGHERRAGIAPPVNPARGLFLWAKENTLAGHHHQTSEHSEPNLSRKAYACWSTGCLCDLRPDYDPFNKWNLGFAFVESQPDGDFQVHNKRIINGRVL